jgi:hypothetical protein
LRRDKTHASRSYRPQSPLAKNGNDDGRSFSLLSDILRYCMYEPLKIHQSANHVCEDGTPKWTKQFEHYLRESSYTTIVKAQSQWDRWWENEYIVDTLYKHFSEDAVWAVVSYLGYPDDAKAIADEVGHLTSWIDHWCTILESYVKLVLAPKRDRPRTLSEIA